MASGTLVAHWLHEEAATDVASCIGWGVTFEGLGAHTVKLAQVLCRCQGSLLKPLRILQGTNLSFNSMSPGTLAPN